MPEVWASFAERFDIVQLPDALAQFPDLIQQLSEVAAQQTNNGQGPL